MELIEMSQEELAAFEAEDAALNKVAKKLKIKHTVWSTDQCLSDGFNNLFPLTITKSRVMRISKDAVWCTKKLIDKYKKEHPKFNPERSEIHLDIEIPQGATWGSLWQAIDKLVGQTGDVDHRFIEQIYLERGKLGVFFGS